MHRLAISTSAKNGVRTFLILNPVLPEKGSDTAYGIKLRVHMNLSNKSAMMAPKYNQPPHLVLNIRVCLKPKLVTDLPTKDTIIHRRGERK